VSQYARTGEVVDCARKFYWKPALSPDMSYSKVFSNRRSINGEPEYYTLTTYFFLTDLVPLVL